MKILYLSCHAVLEYDELKLFEEIGYDYFSLGSYLDPQNPVDPIRPALTKTVDPELYHMAPPQDALPREFIDKFDVIIVMHIPEWIEKNWENMRHKKVIWRTIGQSTPAMEARLLHYRSEGLKIVRYSPYEERMSNYLGHDTIIRFYKDPGEFGNWSGENEQVVTISQNMKHRGEFCRFDTFEEVTRPFPRRLYGTKNEDAGDLNGGFLTYQQMKEVYRKNRVYFYTGTQPAAYTLNFMEAWMTGIPIVAIGEQLANSLRINGDSYEVADIIRNNPGSGFVSNYVPELTLFVKQLLENEKVAARTGEAGRKAAIQLFGKDTIREQWKNFIARI